MTCFPLVFGPILQCNTADWFLCWWLQSWWYCWSNVLTALVHPGAVLGPSSIALFGIFGRSVPAKEQCWMDCAALPYSHMALSFSNHSPFYSQLNIVQMVPHAYIMCLLLHWVELCSFRHWFFSVSLCGSSFFGACSSPTTSPAVLPLCTSSDAACNKEVPPIYDIS